MKLIPLTHCKFAMVDDEDFERLAQMGDWGYYGNKGSEYPGIYLMTNKGRMTIHMHSFLVETKSGQWVDHKDRNPLNCQKLNLRVCTPSQNHANSRLRKDSTTGGKGVTFCNKRNLFYARGRKNGKTKFLGYFSVFEDACRAYDKWAISAFGEFACTNHALGVIGDSPTLEETDSLHSESKAPRSLAGGRVELESLVISTPTRKEQ